MVGNHCAGRGGARLPGGRREAAGRGRGAGASRPVKSSCTLILTVSWGGNPTYRSGSRSRRVGQPGREASDQVMSRRSVVRAASAESATARPATSAAAAANGSALPAARPWAGPNAAAPTFVPARVVAAV
jgi:hypothetical protein